VAFVLFLSFWIALPHLKVQLNMVDGLHKGAHLKQTALKTRHRRQSKLWGKGKVRGLTPA
jgi:hypothetical protein